MEAPKNKWQGLGTIVVVRQSNDKDGTSSTAAQLDFMKKELQKVGLLYVDKVVMDGVSGSAPARMSAVLENLIDRKNKKKDFEVIAWQVEDRASRGGGEHGMWLEHEAKRHGIRVFFAGDDQPVGPYAPVVRVAKYEAAKELSVSNGRRSAQGQKWAQKQGFFRTGGQTPIGCDRIYYGPDNKPKFIIHNLPNGLQEQRDYVTGAVIGTYGTIGKKSRNRFKKQRNEYSLLYPGDRDRRQVVRVIFYLRYKKGWRGCRIADYLNRHGITSPKGKEWSQRQVQIIYENEAYTGVTYNDQTFSGRFFRRDRMLGFVPLDRDECELVLKKSFAPKLRPMDDWDRIDQPHMYDFLPRDVRDLAITAHAAMWEERTDPTRPRKKPNAHPASDYLLSSKLRAVQDGDVLMGSLSGPPDKKTPYYRHRRSKRGRLKGSIYNHLIPAKPLHDAVVALLAEVLVDTPNLKARLSQHVHDQRKEARQDQPDVAQLEAEREELKQQINATVRSLRGAALEDAEEELKRLGDRRNAIETRLATIKKTQHNDDRPIEAVVDEALEVLADESERLLNLPIEPLRNMVNCFVADATVDMETKAVDLKLTLPTWALHAQAKTKNRRKLAETLASDDPKGMCPATSLRSQAGSWTHAIMASAECTYEHRRGSTTKPPCYICRRKAA